MKKEFWRAGLWLQSLLYIAGGVNHFWHEIFYAGIMPDHYSRPALLVELSGLAEIALGIGLLIPPVRRLSAIGIMLMLVIYTDVHIFMLQHADRFPQVPIWLLWVRLPLQALLFYWAWIYARPQAKDV